MKFISRIASQSWISDPHLWWFWLCILVEYTVLSVFFQLICMWMTSAVHSVTNPQSHSFSSDTTLSPSFKSNYNTPTGDTSVNFSASFTSSTVAYDENTLPLERGDPSQGTCEVLCTWCNTYIKHGRERYTRSTLHKHQKGQKCRSRLIGVQSTI